LRASTLIGLTSVPAYIRIANDNESLVMALVENIQRHDLDPIEIAISYQRLIEEIQLTQEKMNEKFSKRTISNSRIGSYLLGPIYEMGSITKNQSLEGFDFSL